MTARVLEYFSSFLPLWGGRKETDRRRLERIEFVLREFESLDRGQQQEVARDLAQLWEAFVGHFGSVEGFLTDAAQARDYVQRVETAARRMRTAKNSEKGHYFFATAMVAYYLRALHDRASEIDDQRSANRIVALIDHGRQLLSANGDRKSVH
jgi:hypothetical protein